MVIMKQHLEKISEYLKSESYLMALRELDALVEENEKLDIWLSLEANTDIDVLHTCLNIVTGERAGYPVMVKHYAHKVSLYERLATLLTRRLLGDKGAGQEIDTLLFCEEALGKVRWN
jgi:hypothetical protein